LAAGVIPQKKKFFTTGKIILFAILAVVIVAAIVLIILLAGGNGGSSSKFLQKQDVINYDYDYNSESLTYTSTRTGVSITQEFDDYSWYTIVTSMDGTKAMVVTESYDDRTYEYLDAVHYFDGTTSTEITENAYGGYLSADGSAVAYMTDVEDGLGDVYLYSNGQSRLIASDAYLTAISPNGGTVAYVKGWDYYGDDGTAYFWDGSEHEIGRNKIIFAVADNAKYIYYNKYESDEYVYTTYVQQGDDDNTRVKLTDSVGSIYFNRDMSEIFFTDGEKTYLCKQAGEKMRLGSGELSPVLPSNIQTFYASSSDYLVVYGVDSFANIYLLNYADDKILFLNSDSTTSSVTSGSYQCMVANDGRTLVFLKGDSLRMIDATRPNAEATTLAEDVYDFTITEDASVVFYLTNDGEIYSVKGTNRPQLVSDDPDTSWLSTVLYQGKTLYFLCDDALYCSSGERATKVATFEEDLNFVYTTRFGVYMYTSDNDETVVYYSSNGSTFTRIGNN